ncbi:L-lactate dehydrogenase [Kocuria coralli]|uniref:L-lactate dehydrogenase n=1 Tax=Kocuria coralli TaxID=1461025 RepID=A0A5J5L0A6_9MICC|nr:L-lactate dehydrogenase [Kocuria coralli]KAA9395282.1 L-lactate dehydrogenase [Kocuria coralli]
MTESKTAATSPSSWSSGTAGDRRSKIGIVGAGAVGSSLAYFCQIRGIAREIAIYDVASEKVHAEAADLSHGAMFSPSTVVSGSDDVSVLAGADIVVITAGAKQKPGQPRLELAEANVNILRAMTPKLLEVAPDAVYVLVTNPCDVLTSVFRELSGLPKERVMSSGTVLDTSRLRLRLSEEAGVSPTSVHAMIVGEHGDTEFPLWSIANIGSVPLLEWRNGTGELAFPEDVRDTIADEVMHAAYSVIAGKGATNYAIGMAGGSICQAILSDQHAVMPVSTILEDYQGVSGVALSVPSVVGRAGVLHQLPVPMSDGEVQQLHKSADALRSSLSTLGF